MTSGSTAQSDCWAKVLALIFNPVLFLISFLWFWEAALPDSAFSDPSFVTDLFPCHMVSREPGTPGDLRLQVISLENRQVPTLVQAYAFWLASALVIEK